MHIDNIVFNMCHHSPLPQYRFSSTFSKLGHHPRPSSIPNKLVHEKLLCDNSATESKSPQNAHIGKSGHAHWGIAVGNPFWRWTFSSRYHRKSFSRVLQPATDVARLPYARLAFLVRPAGCSPCAWRRPVIHLRRLTRLFSTIRVSRVVVTQTVWWVARARVIFTHSRRNCVCCLQRFFSCGQSTQIKCDVCVCWLTYLISGGIAEVKTQI